MILNLTTPKLNPIETSLGRKGRAIYIAQCAFILDEMNKDYEPRNSLIIVRTRRHSTHIMYPIKMNAQTVHKKKKIKPKHNNHKYP